MLELRSPASAPQTADVQATPLLEWVLPKLYASGLTSRSSVFPNPQLLITFPQAPGVLSRCGKLYHLGN